MTINGTTWGGMTFHDSLPNAPIFRVDYSTINGVPNVNMVAIVSSDHKFAGQGGVIGTPVLTATKAVFNVALNNGATGQITVTLDHATPGSTDISPGKVTCSLSGPGNSFSASNAPIAFCRIVL